MAARRRPVGTRLCHRGGARGACVRLRGAAACRNRVVYCGGEHSLAPSHGANRYDPRSVRRFRSPRSAGGPLAATARSLSHPPMKSFSLAALIIVLYVLHQDFWFWRTAHPLVFGFLPIGLAYHGAYCVAAAMLMWLLTSIAWPSHLDKDPGR